jgi:hypothetical protein
MSGIAGLRGTGDWGTDERPKSFREMIQFYNPAGSAPIFGLSSKAGKKVITDPEHSWWSEPNDIVRLQVNGALTSGDTTVVVDSADPTASDANKNYGTATHLKEGDLLMVEPAAESDAFTLANYELVEVVAVQSDTQFTVRRGAGGTTAGSISDDAYLFLVGSAYSEGTAAPSAVSRNPIKQTNYTQIFKDAYELTGTANETEARTGDPWSNDKRRKMFDHSAKIEFSLLFGRPHETTGSNGKPLRYMGGFRYFVPNYHFSSAPTMDTWITNTDSVFDFDTGSGNTRMMFCGRGALQALNSILVGTTGTRMELGNRVKVYGREFRELHTTSGTILMSDHPLMNRHAVHKYSAAIMDWNAFKYTHLRNRDMRAKDDVQSKDEDIRRGYFQTECSCEIDFNGLSQKFITGIVSS